MIQQNKLLLLMVLNKISLKYYSLLMKKLILLEDEKQQSRHIRHYDYECEGVNNLQKFIQRKIDKNLLWSIQKLKEFKINDNKIGQLDSTNYLDYKNTSRVKNQHDSSTRVKFWTRVNTTMEESDNSFIFSPNLRKNWGNKKNKQEIRTQSTLTEPSDKSVILHKLLDRVKKANSEAYQESLKPAKSSYFNMTLGGKASLQTFQNYQNCNCSYTQKSSNQKKQNRLFKRQRILQKIERIERKIQLETFQPIIDREKNFVYRPLISNMNKPQKRQKNLTEYTYEQKPQAIYVISRQNSKQKNGLMNTRSMAQMNYMKQVNT